MTAVNLRAALIKRPSQSCRGIRWSYIAQRRLLSSLPWCGIVSLHKIPFCRRYREYSDSWRKFKLFGFSLERMKRFLIPFNMSNHRDRYVEFWALWQFSLRPFEGIPGGESLSRLKGLKPFKRWVVWKVSVPGVSIEILLNFCLKIPYNFLIIFRVPILASVLLDWKSNDLKSCNPETFVH